MDALSHALIAYILFFTAGLSPLIPFVILGAVIIDADIFFPLFSDNIPSLYLFTHGGITHSLSGAIAMSVVSYIALMLVSAAGIIPEGILSGAGIWGFVAILTGSLIHLAIDLAACPGIPLLAPFIDRKYTLGILPGPSILLAIAAVGTLTATFLNIITFSTALTVYAGSVIAYFTVRIAAFLYADLHLTGRKIPSINPLRWLIIRDEENHWKISTYTFGKGTGARTELPKFQETDADDIHTVAHLPEVRRFLFHSYCVAAERIGSILILADPVREKRYVYYPPKFRRVAVSFEKR